MSGRSVLWIALLPFVLLVMLASGPRTTHAADPSNEKVLFEESFSDAPGKDWSWVGEIPDHWKIDKEQKELLIRPIWGMKNVLLRTPPDITDRPIAIELHLSHIPKTDYEAGALIWYFDGDNFMTVVKELMDDGKFRVFLARRKAGKRESPTQVTYDKPDVDLRMVVTGGKAEGWYRASSADKWQSLGSLEMPSSGAAKVGLRTANGEEDKPTWVRFSKFRILQLEP